MDSPLGPTGGQTVSIAGRRRLGFDDLAEQARTPDPSTNSAQAKDRGSMRKRIHSNRLLADCRRASGPRRRSQPGKRRISWIGSGSRMGYLKAGQMYMTFRAAARGPDCLILRRHGNQHDEPDRGWNSDGGRALGAQFRLNNGTAGGAVNQQWETEQRTIEDTWHPVAGGMSRPTTKAQSVGAKMPMGLSGTQKPAPSSWLAQRRSPRTREASPTSRARAAPCRGNGTSSARGNNLKITDEFLQSNRAVPEWAEQSAGAGVCSHAIQLCRYETGFRWNAGMTQDNYRTDGFVCYLVELHGILACSVL